MLYTFVTDLLAVLNVVFDKQENQFRVFLNVSLNLLNLVTQIAVPEPTLSCAMDRDATIVPQRHN